MASTPTCTTCNSESVFWASSTALRAARSASSEPSVASRILVGKMLIASLSFPVDVPSRDLCQLYQYPGLSQGDGGGTTPLQKGYRGLLPQPRSRGILRSSQAQSYPKLRQPF